jgi:predicted transport protein
MSVEALKQTEAKMLKTIEEKFGKKISEWKTIVDSSGLIKHGEIVTMLKEKYGFGHGYAGMLTHMLQQTHAAAAEDQDALITNQYKGKDDLKTWYDKLVEQIKGFGPDVELSPKKAYVSLRRKKQFAMIQPSTKTRMDIGLNLKNVAPEGKLQIADIWNGMCSHRIIIEKEKDINDDVINWMKQAYEKAG